ncbi:hypothetical protein FWK35_00034164 [Aphis craccivora]|uniref:Uncharacterized protein n=1 Tax=Aphis craccivora TaxID=307492 RepID=A0A6G0VM91_APHCR|nr:hypothetical protein FWK35_00034164 [Aphis craccivora]
MMTLSLLLAVAIPSDNSILNFACTNTYSNSYMSVLNVSPVQSPSWFTLPLMTSEKYIV